MEQGGVNTWKSSDPINMDKNTKREVKKQPFAFKLEKKSKLKTNLQGSVVRAFINPKDLKDSKKLKKEPLKLDLMCELCDENPDELIEEEKLSYTEPVWGGKPDDVYKMKVLEAGDTIVKLDLSSKNYHVVGVSQASDICISHETVSNFHAIMQYRKVSDMKNENGLYIYDLNSEYGTFLNGSRIKPFKYTIVHGGDMIHFGNSPRKYILQTSKEEELEQLELLKGEELNQERLMQEEEDLESQREMKGIDWGISESLRNSESSNNEDSDDNEDLFIKDPKKALRDWFKWEGYDLEYQTEDRGFGKFSCCIDLTLNPFSGETERIQVIAVGDKMKAIDECALKACRFLNDNGLLKQAHEEKKSISKNWEEVDYYDSDEDKYLDRTGIIERKRQHRMQIAGKSAAKSESLLEENSRIDNRIKELEGLLANQKTIENKKDSSDEDTLDTYMSRLETSNLNKTDIRNIKTELHNLYCEKRVVNNSIMSSELNEMDFQKSHTSNITEKIKNGCRFNS